MSTSDQRIRDNIEAGYECPDCPSKDVQSITALTGRVDAGTMTEQWGCNECGMIGVEQDFRSADAEPHISDKCPTCNLDCRLIWPACELL